MDLPTPEQLQKEVDRLTAEMSDLDVMRRANRMKELAHELRQKRELLEMVEKLASIDAELSDVTSLFNTSDEKEMRVLALEDQGRLEKEREVLLHDIQRLLVPIDPRDSRNVVLEIRAGAGGEEASLFASELFRAYTRYAESRGWNVCIVNKSISEVGGFKEVIAEFSGDNVFGILKYERGVHRVQRIPETEKMGRVHTSTITVAVMPEAEAVDIEIKQEDLRIDTFRSSGAGGQHVNKTSSAVRITHLPTNTVAACQQERSQHKNREKAMSILRSRLLAQQEEEKQKQEASTRRAQVGTGDRSEKIRTYNFPQDRITDHRIKKSWSNIPVIMEGEMDTLFLDLAHADQEISLQHASDD